MKRRMGETETFEDKKTGRQGDWENAKHHYQRIK